jgi:phosphoribosylamine---glycine ligase
MKILVIGGGGREHALVWKLRQSPSVSKLWCAPGNGGISQDAECIAAHTGDVRGLAELAELLGADLTVVGPEQPLVLGVADEFARRGLPVLAPSKQAAQLEGSKVFTKRFLERHSLPTAAVLGIYDSAADALDGLKSAKFPVVLKADGLCAGKGVLVAESFEEAASFVQRAMQQREFGDGGARLLVEEALAGKELSFIVLADGQRFVPLAPTRDHKRVFDQDRGPNTGGMGAYSTDDIVSGDLNATILDTIVRPTLDGLAADGCLYKGFLYFGLMLTAQGPKVLEFNCRLGDPETQPIMMRAAFDLAEVLAATAAGNLDPAKIRWEPGASLCVVMASGGYPGKFDMGTEILGLAEAAAVPGACVFHAGTRREGDEYYTCSGRVLGVTARGSSVEKARETAYLAASKIQFAGAHYRTDIAKAALSADPSNERLVARD